MKKISDEEFFHLNEDDPDDGGNKRWPFYSAISALSAGENLIITKEEWNGCRNPFRICRYLMKKHPKVQYSFKKLSDKSGWAIRRVE